MANETLSATTTIKASADAVFAVLTDPAAHGGIDGTGWVREPRDGEQLTDVGQVFRMAMYHDNHPDGHYEMANKVRVLDPGRAICWEPGQDAGDGTVGYGGWLWRYDLIPVRDSETAVKLSYDWSAVPDHLRENIPFPPFDATHLVNSLSHLAEIVASRMTPGG